jgi:hypothetical protein
MRHNEFESRVRTGLASYGSRAKMDFPLGRWTLELVLDRVQRKPFVFTYGLPGDEEARFQTEFARYLLTLPA